jgi:hypothetical protein
MITDTTSEAEDRQIEIFRRMSGEDRLRAAMTLSDQMRDIALAGFRSRHPQWGAKEIMDLFIKEIHGIELKRKVGGAYHVKPD